MKEIALTQKNIELLQPLFQQQVAIHGQIQLVLAAILSTHSVDGRWVMSPCGTKLVKQEEPK